MANTDLSVKIDADAEEAIKTINRVTEAVKELNEALEELGSESIEINFDMGRYDTTTNTGFEIEREANRKFKGGI